MWIDKYRPQSSSDLIGQAKNVARIKTWLKTFEPARSRPLFVYGPPGIGKTTAIHVCCKETGFHVVEFNASDQRNKNIIKDVINTLSSNSRLNFFGRASETRDAIILDEIDGMAGNEDRGGIAQLLIEIKLTKKPMIFICNDGQHQKLRSLKDKCEIIEFKRPDYDAIRSVVARIASKEGLRLDKINVKNLAESSDYDIRQVLNSLYLFKDGGSDEMVKTTRLNAFEATKKVLTASRLSIEERFDCFFADYNIMPLFMFENYAKNRPTKGDHLETVSRAAQSLCLSDLVDKEIRSNQNWSLLNAQALLSTVIPSKLIESHNVGRIDFPQFLGKLSNANKRLRLTQELNAHMCLSLRGGLDSDYLEVMQRRLSGPLIKKEALGGIDSVIDFMHDYSLLRDDFNSIMELAAWSFKPDPMNQVDSKTKTAFTLAFKKRSIALPYFVDDKISKKKKTAYTGDSAGEDDDEDNEEEEEPVIKPKKVTKQTDKPAKKTVSKPASKQPVKRAAKSSGKVDEKATEKPEDKPASKPVVKRPPEAGSNNIARFFNAKKQKSS